MEGKLYMPHTTAGVVKPIMLKANIAWLEGQEGGEARRKETTRKTKT
jgi:hypothetical protein